jgi:hypothetical protein
VRLKAEGWWLKRLRRLRRYGKFRARMMPPRFSELTKVRVTCEGVDGSDDGYVIGSIFRDGRWLYKVSVTEDFETTYDNWVPEEWLEKTP